MTNIDTAICLDYSTPNLCYVVRYTDDGSVLEWLCLADSEEHARAQFEDWRDSGPVEIVDVLVIADVCL